MLPFLMKMTGIPLNDKIDLFLSDYRQTGMHIMGVSKSKVKFIMRLEVLLRSETPLWE
jgi:hypothetical protein